MTIVIDANVARRVLSIVDAGLVRGVGNPKAGEMCVEAAVCFALDLPHGDDPQCVSRALRSLKIELNDSTWSSNAARAKGLRRLAVAQLGSRDALDDREFSRLVAKLATQTSVPTALRVAASIHKNPVHAQALRDAANVCEREGTRDSALAAKKAADNADNADNAAYADNADNAAYAANAAANAAYAANAAANAAYAANPANAAAYAAYAAHAAADAADAAARDKVLSAFAEGVVQILIEMDAPGCQWLPLTEVA